MSGPRDVPIAVVRPTDPADRIEVLRELVAAIEAVLQDIEHDPSIELQEPPGTSRVPAARPHPDRPLAATLRAQAASSGTWCGE